MHREWWSCEGNRLAEAARQSLISRRRLIAGSAFSLAAWAGSRSALADIAVSDRGQERDVLVYILLRGGADGMNMVIPYAEDAYYRNRPNLSIASPRDGRVNANARAVDLNGFFGLHPSLSPLLPGYREGRLAIVHACGSQDGTRSHFEAMAAIERGLAFDGPGPANGWLARHLSLTEGPSDSPLRAVAFGGTLPDCLRGGLNTVALESLADFKLETEERDREHYEEALLDLYRTSGSEVGRSGQETIAVLGALRRLDPTRYRASNGAVYPDTDLGTGLKQTACLIHANLGLEVAALDRTGWDTHVAQGSTVGILPLALDDLGRSLAAFSSDLGAEMSRVVVVVMTEFGRRLAENDGLGTDHGRAGVMLVMGGDVKGGRVYARWPGLEERQLDETGDLRVTIDYRDVLGEVLAKRMGNHAASEVFAGYRPNPLGLAA